MLFTDENVTKGIIKDCYRKFKSSVYYSSNLQYLRLKVAEFEEKHDLMEEKIDDLARMLISEDAEKWEELIQKVKFRVFPKISSTNKQDTAAQILSNYSIENSNVVVEKVNFFIDGPIEIFIIDTLWTLIVGKLVVEKNVFGSEVCANIFEKRAFNNDEDNILSSIDFQNLSVYKPYFDGYKRWKNNAIFKIEELYDLGQDSTLLSLDLTNYYYAANFNFDLLSKLLTNENDNRYLEFSFINDSIEELYIHYSKIIQKIRLDVREGHVMIPIGLMSSGAVANLYMHNFDIKILRNKSLAYYSRYVDDIIIVIPTAKNEDTIQTIIKNWFDDSLSFCETGISIVDYPNLWIQDNKVKVLKMFSGQSKTYISLLKEEISNTSEPHLIPSVDINLKEFIQKVHIRPTDTIKFRDLDTLDIDKLSLMKFMSLYLHAKKNTVSVTGKKRRLSYYEKIDRETYEQLKLFF
jgi:hypothetical protein